MGGGCEVRLEWGVVVVACLISLHARRREGLDTESLCGIGWCVRSW